MITLPISATKLHEESPTKELQFERQNSSSDDSHSKSPTFHSNNSKLPSNSVSPPSSRKSSAASGVSSGTGEIKPGTIGSKKPVTPPRPPRPNLPDDNIKPPTPAKPAHKPQVPPRPGSTVKAAPIPGQKPSVILNTPGKYLTLTYILYTNTFKLFSSHVLESKEI